jgi:hypothetical protein
MPSDGSALSILEKWYFARRMPKPKPSTLAPALEAVEFIAIHRRRPWKEETGLEELVAMRELQRSAADGFIELQGTSLASQAEEIITADFFRQGQLDMDSVRRGRISAEHPDHQGYRSVRAPMNQVRARFSLWWRLADLALLVALAGTAVWIMVR